MDLSINMHRATLNIRAAGILVHHNHVLLQKDTRDSFWSLPGGRCQLLENTSSAVIREFLEECGLEVKTVRMIWVVENFFNYNRQAFHELGFYYQLSLTNTKIQIDLIDEIELEAGIICRWFPIHELLDTDIKPQFLKDGLQNLPIQTIHLVIRQADK